MDAEALSAGRRESSGAASMQLRSSLRYAKKNDHSSSVRAREPRQVTDQEDEGNEANWAEAEELTKGLASLLCIGSFIYSCIYDVTQNYVHPNGRAGRQFFFIYTLINHFGSAVHAPSPIRRLINRLLGSATVPVLYLTIVIFSATMSAISIISIRYFYLNICDVYGSSESIIWHFFINGNFLLFTYLFSRLAPSVVLIAWFVVYQFASTMWWFLGNVSAILVYLARLVQDIQGHLLPASKFVAHHQSWYWFVWLLVLMIYLTRDTTWMKNAIEIVTRGLNIIWSIILSMVTLIFVVTSKAVCKLVDKMLERVVGAVRYTYLRKYESKIQPRLVNQLMKLCKNFPLLGTLRNNAKRRRTVSNCRPTFRTHNSIRYRRKSNAHVKTHRLRIPSTSGNGESVRIQLSKTRSTSRSITLPPSLDIKNLVQTAQ